MHAEAFQAVLNTVRQQAIIRVKKNNIGTFAHVQTRVAGDGHSLVLLPKVADLTKSARHRRSFISGTVIHNDQFYFSMRLIDATLDGLR